MLPRRIVYAPDITPTDDRFIDLEDRAGPVEWVRLSGLPATAIERRITRPRLSRYRAAWQAARAAGDRSIVISGLPLMTGAVANALTLARKHPAHLAFAFNFTTLPNGARRAWLARSFAGVTQFTPFAAYERDLYARTFGIDPAKIKPVIWTQEAPAIAPPGPPPRRPYVCAIGGEGRDFGTLLDALARRPRGIDAIIVARPHSLTGLTLPDGVQVLSNLPFDRTWRIAVDSLGVLVPLRDEETCCGHLTLVCAKLLGVPLVTSFSKGTIEYVEDREAVLVTPPNDAVALRQAIERLGDEAAALQAAAGAAVPAETAFHDRSKWADYLADFLRAH
ncbi:glycosyltransferase [Sphingomonas bacterium]|uniref:glycosyltransferase n=1 Tax=Sphingomonas bacterium TaxID=1895847 RepID=UPI001576BB0A|nr:glycosyltransferase [Sphingomonas bacterium]